MAKAPKKPKDEAPADEGTPMLALIETPNLPVPTVTDQARIVLLDSEKFDQFYDRMKAETSKLVPDVTTAKGRDEIRSMAFRVTKTKTALFNEAKNLTEDWRTKTKAVNDARGEIVDRLERLADEVRKPLTEWEEAEEARVTANEAVLAEIRQAAVIAEDDTAEGVADRGRRIWAMTFEAPQWSEDEAAEATATKDATVAALVAARTKLIQAEKDAADLARLRAAEDERLAKEANEQAARDLAGEAVHRQGERDPEADAIALSIIADVLRERELDVEVLAPVLNAAADPLWIRWRDDRLARIAREAEEVEAARVAMVERTLDHIRAAGDGTIGGQPQSFGVLIYELEHKVTIGDEFGDQRAEAEKLLADTLQSLRDAMAAQREKAEADAEAERKRIAEEAAATAAEAERVRAKRVADEAEATAKAAAAEQEKRERNRTHRGNVMREAKEALMTCGIDEEKARVIVTAIVAGNVPHTSIAF